ncbi:corrinoid ABC transporter substrate-binding protein [Anatilimnocola aggregata]|uniref:Corrinoid ABC transporter substrate-binding protein n=2 Tax=Anatilimnocola aggregata TaxID=2528021 RepID=A0A517Y5G1_9BACT|nr:corrinoid ABC transporter substrate-binding protein [Anatilimnocola aggregata]
MLFALGLGEQVLAVSHECDWPVGARHLPRATHSRIDSSQPSDAIDAQVKQLVAGGEQLYELNEPLLRQLQPDLIVTQAQCDVCAIRLADVLKLRDDCPELRATRVLPLNPLSLADVLADIARVGEATGVPSRAADLVAGYRARIDSIASRTNSLAARQRPRVLCIEWVAPLMPAGNWTPELIHLAGGDSGLAIAGQHSRYATWAEVAAFDPQVILVAPCGFNLPRTLIEAEQLHQVPGWQNFTALRTGRVFAIDGNGLLNRSGPRLIESLELLAQLLQPEMFADFGLRSYWQPLVSAP